MEVPEHQTASYGRQKTLFTREDRLKPLLSFSSRVHHMQFQDALLQGVSLGNQKGCLPAPPQNSKGEFVSTQQRYVALMTSAHPLGRVCKHTTRAASGAASERAACESPSTWRNKPFPQKAEEASCQESRLQSKPLAPSYARTASPRRRACVSVCGGVVFKRLLTTQIPSRTTKSKRYSSQISQRTTAAFRH